MEKSKLYLGTPSNTSVEPPVDSTGDDLPIEKLSWEDFEKLCLRLVELNHSINDCEIYGIKGEKQEGIDVFARISQGKYNTYQCKRYKKIMPSTLTKAISAFKKGEWYSKSTAFYFCTTFSLNQAKLQDKFNALKGQLEADGVLLVKWDKIQICRVLKSEPQLVYDFFGREWVKYFNGEEKLLQISSQRKLDANEVISFRKELYNFYSIVFNTYDVGLPTLTLNNSISFLEDRFIMQEAFEQRIDDDFSFKEEKTSSEIKEENYDLDALLPNYEKTHFYKERSKIEEESLPFIKHRNRLSIDEIIVKHNKSIIIGDPGAGKSTLLRNLVLDILAEQPRYIDANSWGRCLPIWLPFAFITKNILENNNLSIEELLRIWFKNLGEEPLFEIVENALTDERLVLVVDGVDELSNTSSARKAIDLIEIHSKLNNIGVIYSSRPYGYKLLASSFKSVYEINLLPFSENQQKLFIDFWYKEWFKSLGSEDVNYRTHEAAGFFNELKRSVELAQVAKNPLLLSILISQKLRDAHLSNSKVKAIEAITKHLIETHPQNRMRSASIVADTETGNQFDFDLIDLFEELALYVQEFTPNGIIDKSQAIEVIIKYLEKWFEYPLPRAKKRAEDILTVGAKDFGIIIEKAADEIAFSHRLFQEFLAARYLINSEEREEELLSKYGGMPVWHQVIKFYFQLIPHKRPKRFTESLKLLGQNNNNEDNLKSLSFLKYDIALTSSNVPLKLSQEYFAEVTEAFEYETDDRAKKIYWKLSLDALSNTKIKEEVQSFLFGYFPNFFPYSDYRVIALKKIPIKLLRLEHKEFLLKTLINGNVHQKIDASYTIRYFIEDEWLCEKIIDLLDDCTNLKIIPFVLNVIITEKIEEAIQRKYFYKFENIAHPETKLFLIKLKVHLKLHEYNEYNELVKLEQNLSYLFEDEILYILIQGWKDNLNLMELCLEAIEMNRIISSKIAWKILFSCFNNQQKVVDKIIEELKRERYPFIDLSASYYGFEYIAEYFKDNIQLIPEIDNWIQKQNFREPAVAYASRVGRTKRTKEYLMKHLAQSRISHWYCGALLNGYGDDVEVIEFLKDYFKSENSNKIMSAHEISRVFKNDKKEGVRILEELIFSKQTNIDRVVIGLINLDKDYFRENILEKFLGGELPRMETDFFGTKENILHTIIENYKDEQVVKEYVIKNLSTGVDYLSLFISIYPKNEDMINKALSLSKSLDVEYRLELIERLGRDNVIQETYNQLELFESEKEGQVSSAAAIEYFKYLNNQDRQVDIIEIAEKNIFYRGFDYNIQRQLAFCGYLLIRELPQYFAVKESKTNELANPEFNFETYTVDVYESITNFVIENFDYLSTTIAGDFSLLTKWSNLKEQSYWSFWAKYSGKSSPTYQYIRNYIDQNEEEINEFHLLSFLDRTAPDSNVLKNICIRLLGEKDTRKSIFAAILLGKNFNTDNSVYDVVKDVSDIENSEAKLLALCVGWEEDPILKKIYQDLEKAIIDNNPLFNFDRHLTYHLLYFHRGVERIMLSFNRMFNEYHYKEIQNEHQCLINPFKRRLKRDDVLQLRIKEALLKSEIPAAAVSFYAILKSLNKIDEEILKWKKQALENGDVGFGYNILSNEFEHFSWEADRVEYFN